MPARSTALAGNVRETLRTAVSPGPTMNDPDAVAPSSVDGLPAFALRDGGTNDTELRRSVANRYVHDHGDTAVDRYADVLPGLDLFSPAFEHERRVLELKRHARPPVPLRDLARAFRREER